MGEEKRAEFRGKYGDFATRSVTDQGERLGAGDCKGWAITDKQIGAPASPE